MTEQAITVLVCYRRQVADVAPEPKPAARSTESVEPAPALVTAAETFLRTRPGETLDGVVATRALGHYWEGLGQYLAIRAQPEGALRVLEELAHRSAAESLLAPPGPRARLFRRARALVKPLTSAPALGAIPWWESPDPARAMRLGQLRASLDPASRELLELRYARALTSAEIAYVLERPVADVDADLERARGDAERVLRDLGAARRDLDDYLLEAFALRRTTKPRPVSPHLAVGEVVGDRYEIESHLGSGAFADVYRARDREVPDHVVALKIRRLPARDEVARVAARRELRLIASVFHPSVVQLKDHGWHDGKLWFVMPWYRGETLAARLRRGPLTRREAKTIFDPLANALAAMHRAGVRHQDIKPENIFLARLDPDEEGASRILPVFLDLGVAVKDAEAVLAGTPGYFAPEVAARFAGIPDPPPLSDRSDVFALALALRESLEPETIDGVVGGSVDAFIARRARRVPTPPRARELAFLRPFFDRWLALKPDERPSAEELVRELDVLTRPEEVRARRAAVLRWVGPVFVAFAALTAAALWISSREVDMQRMEAQRARQQADAQRTIAESARARAANFRDDLTAEARMRRALQQEVARLEQEYESSRMTRADLVTRLAETEGELRLVTQRQAEAARTAAHDLGAMQAERDQLQALSDEHAAALAQVRGRVASLTETEQQLRRRIVETERERDAALERQRALERRLRALDPLWVPQNPFEGAEQDGTEPRDPGGEAADDASPEHRAASAS